MKVLRYISLAAVLLATACTDELPTYSGRDNVYFFYGRGYTGVLSMAEMTPGNALAGHSTGFDYAKIDLDTGKGAVADSVVSIQIFCNGPLSPVDREVAVVADPDNMYTEDGEGNRRWDTDAREGVEFEILSASILANQPYGYVKVKLIRTDSLNNAGSAGLNLRLKLMPNQNFDTAFDLTSVAALNGATREYYHLAGRDAEGRPMFNIISVRRYNTLNYTLGFNDAHPISPLWRRGVTGESYIRLRNILGEYSVRKMEFVNETLGFDWTFLFPTDEMVAASGNPGTPLTYFTSVVGWTSTTFAAPIMRAMNKAMIQWREANVDNLDVPKDLNGVPLMIDENGNPVTFPGTQYI